MRLLGDIVGRTFLYPETGGACVGRVLGVSVYAPNTVLVCRENTTAEMAWDATLRNYDGSAVDLAAVAYLNQIAPALRALVPTVTIPIITLTGTTQAKSTLQRKVFLLTRTEVLGTTESDHFVTNEDEAGMLLPAFLHASWRRSDNNWWLRSFYYSPGLDHFEPYTAHLPHLTPTYHGIWLRPAFNLPEDLCVSDVANAEGHYTLLPRGAVDGVYIKRGGVWMKV